MFEPTSLAAPILVAGIDFSEASSLVLAEALAAARQLKAAQLHFLHVVPESGDDSLAARRCETLSRWLGDSMRQAEALPRGTQVLAHESAGDPARAIVELADRVHASCVLVGARCRNTGASDTLLGSVARAVVAGATCPVLIVRPRRQAARPSDAQASAAAG